MKETHPQVLVQILLERKLDRWSGSSDLVWVEGPHSRMYATAKLLHEVGESLSELSDELVPFHATLVHIRRQLVALAAKPKPPKADLKPLRRD